ncbi:MAG: sensor histidine kinase [Fimbriimonadales bacterium]
MLRSHRARLTLASAGSAGLLLLILFAVSAIGLRNAEVESAQSQLAPAVSLVMGDVRAGHRSLDLAEVVGADPQVSLAAFDSRGNLRAKDGSLALPFSKAIGLWNGPAGPVMLRSESLGDTTVVAGLNWSPHEALVHRFVLLCAILWLPVVSLVALATWLTARATFLPLQRLSVEAETLSAESLSARLHVADSGEYRDFVLRLNRFLDRLEGSVKREERFLSDAAHELRTPLTVLRGQIETALSRRRTDEEYRSTLVILGEEAGRLTSLVELLLRSAAPPDQDSAHMNLAEATERAHARWVDRFAEKGARLLLQGQPSEAEISESEFDVIIDNLLSNGLRACDPGSTCEIHCRGGVGVALLRVADDGTGMAPSEMEGVFERFARVDPGRSREGGGFGIGLALCKRIVETRGGRIWVESNKPRGCIFNVEFRSRTEHVESLRSGLTADSAANA